MGDTETKCLQQSSDIQLNACVLQSCLTEKFPFFKYSYISGKNVLVSGASMLSCGGHYGGKSGVTYGNINAKLSQK